VWRVPNQTWRRVNATEIHEQLRVLAFLTLTLVRVEVRVRERIERGRWWTSATNPAAPRAGFKDAE
jgi:hypothetical protein